jgi:hypothetical protein
MANQRASSLPELGPLNIPGEVAVSTTSSETTKAQASPTCGLSIYRVVHSELDSVFAVATHQGGPTLVIGGYIDHKI